MHFPYGVDTSNNLSYPSFPAINKQHIYANLVLSYKGCVACNVMIKYTTCLHFTCSFCKILL